MTYNVLMGTLNPTHSTPLHSTPDLPVQAQHTLVSADELFTLAESRYQLEKTARSSQENLDLSDSG